MYSKLEKWHHYLSDLENNSLYLASKDSLSTHGQLCVSLNICQESLIRKHLSQRLNAETFPTQPYTEWLQPTGDYSAI